MLHWPESSTPVKNLDKEVGKTGLVQCRTKSLNPFGCFPSDFVPFNDSNGDEHGVAGDLEEELWLFYMPDGGCRYRRRPVSGATLVVGAEYLE